MTHAVVVLQHRHSRSADHPLDKPLPAAGNDQIEILVHLREMIHALPICEGHELDAVGGKTGLLATLLQCMSQCAIGFDGLRASAQDGGVACLETKHGCIARHIGT